MEGEAWGGGGGEGEVYQFTMPRRHIALEMDTEPGLLVCLLEVKDGLQTNV